MKTHQKGNAIESDLYFIFIGCLTFSDVSHKQRQSAKRREHMSSAQIDVAKRNWTHMKITEKHHTWTHIEKTHEHTTKGKHIKKAWKHIKRETQLKVICLSFSLVFLHWGFLPRWEEKRKEARTHVICTNRRRKKKLDTHMKITEKHHTWTHIEKTHEHTTK